jgi:Helix-turn-helix domain
MATLWSCPKSDCPPTEIAPVDIPESGEAAGAESEPPFTTDEVAALLNVPPDTIYKWHKEGTGPPGIKCTRRATTEGATWSVGWRSKG